jgi:hypothetical protein
MRRSEGRDDVKFGLAYNTAYYGADPGARTEASE